MATKKLAFGGMSSMRNRMQQKPQAPAARTQAAADLAAKAAMTSRAPISGDLSAARRAAMAAQQPRPMKKGGMAHSDVKMDKKVVKKAVKMHDDQLHGGKKTNLTKLKSGGMTCGPARKMAKGGGIEVRGKTKGTMVKMKKGGSC